MLPHSSNVQLHWLTQHKVHCGPSGEWKKTAPYYIHLHQLITIFLKITEIILEDHEMPTFTHEENTTLSKNHKHFGVSLSSSLCALHHDLHLQTHLQSIGVTIKPNSNWIWLAWPSAFLLSKWEALFLQRWSNLRSFKCASITVLWCKLLCHSSCFPYACFLTQRSRNEWRWELDGNIGINWTGNISPVPK